MQRSNPDDTPALPARGQLRHDLWHSLSERRFLILVPLLFAFVLLAAIWSATFSRIRLEEKLAVENATTTGANIAHIVSASLQPILQRTRMYADKAKTLLDNGDADPRAFALNPIRLGDDAYLRIVVLDGNAHLVYNSSRRRAEPELTALARKATQEQTDLARDETGMLSVGQPSPDSANAWQIPVLLPFKSASGKSGYLGALLDLGFFLRLYGGINLGSDGRIEIIDSHGYRFIQTSGSNMLGGANYADTDLFRLISANERGYGMVKHPDDDKMSISVFEKLDEMPLIIAVTQSYESATLDLVQRQHRYYWWAILLSLALLATTMALVLLALRFRAYHRDIVRSEMEKRQLIDELEKEKVHVYHLASHDHLTGLPNRMLFTEIATGHLLRAKRSRLFNALLFIDLDRFKLINDTLGHRVGDLLLQTVAERLRHCLRESDISARFGGDEFVMLLTDVTSIDDIGNIASKIIQAVGSTCRNLDGHDVEVHPSIGIALYPQDGTTVDALIHNADAAMYEAKMAGRNTFRFYDSSLHAHSMQQIELLQQLRKAIIQEQLILHYQPRVSLHDFRLVGLEALVRWQHPEHGLLFPGTFIELAEKHGLIGLLSERVMDAACRQIAEWRSNGLHTVPVAINISALQLKDESLVGQISEVLARYGLPPEALEIELTESCIMEQPEIASSVLSALVARGVRIAIDDYGTGYSSLDYLKILPIAMVKIDRSLIRDIQNDSRDATIVSSTVTLVHNLKLSVVAEGIETREQLVHLKTTGCDEAQGYYFMRPSPAEQIVPVLQSGFLHIQ